MMYLIHLGYLGYDQDAQTAFIPNEEIRQELTAATRRNPKNISVSLRNYNKNIADKTVLSSRKDENTMKYDFTTILDRKGKDSIAVEPFEADWIKWPGKTKEGFDIIPMWVADMNFPAVHTIPEAIIERTKHTTYGYFSPREEYFDATCRRAAANGRRARHHGRCRAVRHGHRDRGRDHGEGVAGEGLRAELARAGDVRPARQVVRERQRAGVRRGSDERLEGDAAPAHAHHGLGCYRYVYVHVGAKRRGAEPGLQALRGAAEPAHGTPKLPQFPPLVPQP